MSKKRKANKRKPIVKRATGYKPIGKGSRKVRQTSKVRPTRASAAAAKRKALNKKNANRKKRQARERSYNRRSN